MRSENVAPAVDCDDAMIKLACSMETEDCPAVCKTTPKDDEPTVVKAGDLAVSATPAEGRRVLKTGISDLDTLTFKTSEEVTLNKVTLERYGYSSDDSDKITGIWLEDQDGNIIADAKTLTKDKASLTIKKDYRKVDGSYVATIVVETKDAQGTIGFKVTDVESTAKNLNVSNYTPYTYEVIDYTGSEVTLDIKGSDKDYNYVEGNSYEIARLKVKASGKDILVRGFTLTNDEKLDMKKFLSKLTVTADSKEIKANYSVNKDDGLVVSFSDVDVAMNKSVLFVLSANFEDFDAYGEAVKYYVASSSDFNAVEKKNGTRVGFAAASNAFNKANAKLHTFNGGKIKLSNTKLGNVDAAQASEGTVVAEGNITITEPLSKINFNIAANNTGAQYIENLFFVVNGEEYEGKKLSTGDISACLGNYFNTGDYCAGASVIYEVKKAGTGTSPVATSLGATKVDALYNFKNVSIDRSGKAQFKVDIKDNSAAANTKISFSPFGSASFDGAKYDNTNKYVQPGDVAGSISFSNVTIQAAKAALENNISKTVEFLLQETNRKTVFDGTYTAKKGAIDLNKVLITAAAPDTTNSKVTFYVSIDGEEVTDATAGVEEAFSDVRVNAGEAVKVKVEAEVEAYGTAGDLPEYTVEIYGTDINGNEDTGKGSDVLVKMSVKTSGSTTISAGAAKSTVLLKAKNQTIAEFLVKPSNSNDEGLTLDKLEFTVSPATITTGDLRVKVAGVEIDADSAFVYSPNEEIPSAGVKVEVILKKEMANTVEITDIEVNGGTPSSRVFSKRFENAIVTVTKQENKGDFTRYTVEVEEYDSTFVVSDLRFYVNSGSTVCNGANLTAIQANCTEVAHIANVEDGITLEADNGTTTQSVTAMTYNDGTTDVVILKSASEDFFKVGEDTLRVYSNK